MIQVRHVTIPRMRSIFNVFVMPSALFTQAYQPLTDNREAKIAFINEALEKGNLQSWRVRTFYRLLGNFVYLTPDGYLVDSAGFYIDAMRYTREGSISASDDETQMDEALWQENFLHHLFVRRWETPYRRC